MFKKDRDTFRSKLITWFSQNKRDLPWRKNPTWYKTYLSEVILQQTTVEQGLPYFDKFIRNYPSITQLAKADEQEILNLWAGLGYYSRARNMLKAAKLITQNYNGIFPDKYGHAIKIPGIGPYSASAILSISYQKPYAVVDGNVIRVISRLFAIKKDVRQTETINGIMKKAKLLLDKNKPGIFNEAMMELGATVCTPKVPNCGQCPVSAFCKSFSKNIVEKIPFKSAASAKHQRYQLALILTTDSEILICRRPGKGLLAGMWEFPAYEINKSEFEADDYLPDDLQLTIQSKSTTFRHIYSHIDLKYKAIVGRLIGNSIKFEKYTDQKWIGIHEMSNFAIHNAHIKLLEWYLNDIKNQNPEISKN